MSPQVDAMQPQQGPTTGGNAVRLWGPELCNRTVVLFDGVPAQPLLVREGACYVQAPPHAPGPVQVAVQHGSERCALPQPYTYTLPMLTRESSLTRLVRALLRDIKAHFLRNTSITVDVEASDPEAPGSGVAMLARLPALVLGGPEVREDRVRSRSVGGEIQDTRGNFVQYAPPFTANLEFSLTGASRSTVELFNMLDAAIAHLHHAKWVTLARDPNFVDLGLLRWPLCIGGGARVFLDGPDGIKSFGIPFTIHGFDIGGDRPTRVAAQTQGAFVATQTE